MANKRRRTVNLYKHGKKWRARYGMVGRIIAAATLKKATIEAAATALRIAWRVYAEPSELFIHARDGRIIERRTYGLDPRRSKG